MSAPLAPMAAFAIDITDGPENAPAAFIGMLEGRNFGKALGRVTPSA